MLLKNIKLKYRVKAIIPLTKITYDFIIIWITSQEDIMAKKEKNPRDAFSIEKLPVGLGVAWSFLSAAIFGVLGASLIIFISVTF